MKSFLSEASYHTLTTMFNAGNVPLYFNSADNFLWHLGVMDRQLTNVRDDWQYYCVIPLATLCFFMLISNHQAYYKNIKKLFVDFEPTANSVWWKILAIITGATKGVITSSSLFALVHDYTKNMRQRWVLPWSSFAISAILL